FYQRSRARRTRRATRSENHSVDIATTKFNRTTERRDVHRAHLAVAYADFRLVLRRVSLAIGDELVEVRLFPGPWFPSRLSCARQQDTARRTSARWPYGCPDEDQRNRRRCNANLSAPSDCAPVDPLVQNGEHALLEWRAPSHCDGAESGRDRGTPN